MGIRDLAVTLWKNQNELANVAGATFAEARGVYADGKVEPHEVVDAAQAVVTAGLEQFGAKETVIVEVPPNAGAVAETVRTISDHVHDVFMDRKVTAQELNVLIADIAREVIDLAEGGAS